MEPPVKPTDITKIGMIGTGVMGSMITLLLAEHAGVTVYIYDRSEDSMDRTIAKADEALLDHKVHKSRDPHQLWMDLGGNSNEPKVYFFSLPHGNPGEAVLTMLKPYLKAGDIVIDGSNENFTVTQQRQARLREVGAAYIGCGVSGGFRGARNGPSLMPSGEEWALDALMPMLKKIAAKSNGEACVTKVGPSGSGPYVKMVHNGIEHGIMSALAEAWGIMHYSLAMDGNEIGAVFERWNIIGPLRDNFLVGISGPICRTLNEDTSAYLLPEISDAVVQDANDSEGTGVWANINAMAEHVPAPSLAAAHYLRIASSDVTMRERIDATLQHPPPSPIDLGEDDMVVKSTFISDLHSAVYTAVLVCFIQGLNLISVKSAHEDWQININEVLRVWQEGCIIKSDSITDLFSKYYRQSRRNVQLKHDHPLISTEISAEIRIHSGALKRLVLAAVEADCHVPCLSASLEYIKYIGSLELPTAFTEAQLDAFGAHGYEKKAGHEDDLRKPKFHSSWSLD